MRTPSYRGLYSRTHPRETRWPVLGCRRHPRSGTPGAGAHRLDYFESSRALLGRAVCSSAVSDDHSLTEMA